MLKSLEKILNNGDFIFMDSCSLEGSGTYKNLIRGIYEAEFFYQLNTAQVESYHMQSCEATELILFPQLRMTPDIYAEFCVFNEKLNASIDGKSELREHGRKGIRKKMRRYQTHDRINKGSQIKKLLEETRWNYKKILRFFKRKVVDYSTISEYSAWFDLVKHVSRVFECKNKMLSFFNQDLELLERKKHWKIARNTYSDESLVAHAFLRANDEKTLIVSKDMDLFVLTMSVYAALDWADQHHNTSYAEPFRKNGLSVTKMVQGEYCIGFNTKRDFNFVGYEDSMAYRLGVSSDAVAEKFESCVPLILSLNYENHPRLVQVR